MSQGQIRFSIILTCYNQRDFIAEAIESTLSQTCDPPPEVIVVDDGSKDGSVDVIRSYAERVRCLPLATNCGVAEARNHGAAFAEGEYVIFLDGDDLLVPHALEMYEVLIQELRPAFIMGRAQWFSGTAPKTACDRAGETLEFVQYESLMARDRGCGIYNGAFVISRKAFLDAGGWTSGVWHLDGHDLYSKMGYSGRALLLLSPDMMLYRMHGANSINDARSYAVAGHAYIRRERNGLFPGGPERKFDRYARHGGVVTFCARRLWRIGAYSNAVGLLLDGWAMVLAAILRKAQLQMRGKQPVQTRLWHPKIKTIVGMTPLAAHQ